MKTVLIAEDDKTSMKSLESLVRKHGCDVISASNGRRAWDALDDTPEIDLLLTDVMMPEMTGIELIERVRADKRFVQLPVVVVSAYVGVREIASLLEGGATAFLPKPMDHKALGDYLDRYLEHEKAA
jgi:CheY-like chemotaxis protein